MVLHCYYDMLSTTCINMFSVLSMTQIVQGQDHVLKFNLFSVSS